MSRRIHYYLVAWGVIGRVLACLLVVLTGCTLPGAQSQAVSRTSPPLEPVGLYNLRGDPDFDPNRLPSDMKVWHARLWEGIRYLNDYDSQMNPGVQAASGDLYQLGRAFNTYVTTLLNAFRVTKDLALLDEVDRLLEVARAQLADYNGDGYLNWRYLNENVDDSGDGPSLYGDDYHVMDDILTHSLVAAAAGALRENAALGGRYAEHAAFWQDYLKNNFEAKWRARNDEPSGFPFLTRDLMHPYVQFIRYHHYMAELTGDPAYRSEAERMAELVPEQVREVFTSGGPAYVWNQRFLPEGEGDILMCQPFIYLQLTFQAFEDLALEGFGVFDDAFMQRVATAMTALVVEDGYRNFASDICGGFYQAGFYPSGGDGGITYHFVNQPYAEIGKWDATGMLRRNVERAYREVDLDDSYYPRSRVNLSAAMLFLLANDPDSQRAAQAP